MKNMKHPRCMCGLRIRGSVMGHERGAAHVAGLAKADAAELERKSAPWRGIHC